jgi:hypothetical protein
MHHFLDLPLNRVRFVLGMVLVCVLGSSCKEVVNLDPGPGVRAAPVFYAFITPDSPMVFYCWKTQLVTDPEPLAPVTDADIRWYQNGNLMGNAWHQLAGKYHSTAPAPAAGTRISLVVNHPEQSWQIPVQIPGKVSLINPDTASILMPPGGRYFSISFNLSDTAATADCYRLYLLHTQYRYVNNGGSRDSILISIKEEISGSENAFLYNAVNRLNKTEILFTDEALNGLNKRLRFGTFNIPRTSFNGNYRTLGMKVILERMGPDLYHYYNDRALHLSLLGSPVGQGGSIFSNVPGGYGVVGAYTADVFHIQF